MMIQGYTTSSCIEAQAQLLIEDERRPPCRASTARQHVLRGSRAVLQDAVPDSQGARSDAPRRSRSSTSRPCPSSTARREPPSTPLTMRARRRAARLVRRSARQGAAGRKRRRSTRRPTNRRSSSAFIGRVDVAPVRGSRLVDVTFTATRSGVRGAGRQHARRRVRRSEPEGASCRARRTCSTGSTSELDKQQKKVQESERALADYREKQNAMSLDDKQNIVLSRLTQLNDALDRRARTKKAQKEALYNQVRSMSATTVAGRDPGHRAEPAGADVKSQHRRAAAADARSCSEKYGEKHPDRAVGATRTCRKRSSQLDVEIEPRAAVDQERLRDGGARRADASRRTSTPAKADAQDLSQKSVDYNVMEREAKSNRAGVRVAARSARRSCASSSNSRANNVRVDRPRRGAEGADHAGRAPHVADVARRRPRRWRSRVAFGLDYMNDTIKTPEDVDAAAEAAVPRPRAVGPRRQAPAARLVARAARFRRVVPLAAHVAHRRSTRATARRSWSSPARSRSKARRRRRPTSRWRWPTAARACCSIDADMRRPGLHRPLRLTNERGLSQVLIGQARVRDVIQRTVDPNLLAITAGKTPPNPSELLASERMKTLLDEPGARAVRLDHHRHAAGARGHRRRHPGAARLRRHVRHRRGDDAPPAGRARDRDDHADAHPKTAAVVLNKVDFARNKYYYSRYYGHQYKNYYAEAPSSARTAAASSCPLIAGWTLFAFGGAYRLDDGAARRGRAARWPSPSGRRSPGAAVRRSIWRSAPDSLIAALQLVPLPPSIRASALARRDRHAIARCAWRGARAGARAADDRPRGVGAGADAVDQRRALFFWSARAHPRQSGVRRATSSASRCAGSRLRPSSHPAAQRRAAAALRRCGGRSRPNARPVRPFVNRNDLAAWFVMAIPLTLGYLVARFVSRREPRFRSPRRSTTRASG